MPTYVYRITNTLNGKVYIGISSQPKKRLTNHHTNARGGGQTIFARALRKYGLGVFQLDVITGPLTRDQACLEEILQIASYKATERDFGYNQTPGGDNPPSAKGITRSATTRQRISEAHKGKVLSKEHRLKLSRSRIGYKNRRGTTTSVEARLRMSKAHTGLKPKLKTKRAISKTMKELWLDPNYKLIMRRKLVSGKLTKESQKPTIEERILQVLGEKSAPVSEVRSEVKAKNEKFYAAMNGLLSRGRIHRKCIGSFVYLTGVAEQCYAAEQEDLDDGSEHSI